MASLGLAVREGLRLWEADKFEDETRDYTRLQRQADAIKLNAMLTDPNYQAQIQSEWESALHQDRLDIATNKAAMPGVEDAALAKRRQDQAIIYKDDQARLLRPFTEPTARMQAETGMLAAQGALSAQPFLNSGSLADAQRSASQSQFLLGLEPTVQEKQRYTALADALAAQGTYAAQPSVNAALLNNSMLGARQAAYGLSRQDFVESQQNAQDIIDANELAFVASQQPTDFGIRTLLQGDQLAQLVFQERTRPIRENTQEYNLKTDEANAEALYDRADLANRVLDLTLKSQEGAALNTIFDNETLATTADDRRKLAQAQALFTRIDAEYQLTRQEQLQLMQDVLDRVGYRTAKFTLGQLGITQNIERSKNVMAYKDAAFARNKQALSQSIQEAAMQLEQIQTQTQLTIAKAKAAGKALKAVYTPDEMKKVEESLYILSMNSAGIYMDETTNSLLSLATGKAATEDQLKKFQYSYDYGMKAAVEGQSMQVIASGPQVYDLNMKRIRDAQAAEAARKKAASGIPQVVRTPIQGYGVGVITPTGGTDLMINPAFMAPQPGLKPSH